LEALGVKIDLDAQGVKRCIEEVGIGFMFAPVFHPAMKYAAGPRREIGIRTVFNILGPLTNPAGAQAQVVGVADSSIMEKLAVALKGLGCQRAMVVHGEDGLDEITLTGRTYVCELKDNHFKNYTICPEDFGFTRVGPDSLRGGTADENARLLHAVLAGTPGPQRNIVLMNTAAVLLVGGRVTTLKEGVTLAGEVIDSGQARAKLERLIELSQRLGSN
jgi:anthranilate phosphoribosyltransferase